MNQGKRGILGLVLSVLFLGITGCGGGGSSSNGGTLPQTSASPTVSFDGWTPNDTQLVQYKTYTFNASGTDPNIGGSVTEFDWDLGDGTKVVTPVVLANGKATTSYAHSYSTSGPMTLSVVAKNGAGLLSPAATQLLSVATATSPLAVVFTTPAAPVTVTSALGSTAQLNFRVQVTNSGTGTVSASGITLNPGDATATQAGAVDLGNGTFSITVTYPAASAVGSRTATPTVSVMDSNGVASAPVTGPVVTVNTVVLATLPPTITITAPATPTTSALTSKLVTLSFTLTDQYNNPVSYTVDWGVAGTLPCQPKTVTGTTTTSTQAGASVSLTHVYPDTFSGNATVTINATDSVSSSPNAAPQTRTIAVTANQLPTASITSPQASSTLPSLALIQDGGQGKPVIPAGSSDPDVVVIPANGKLVFQGTGTAPTSGGTLTYRWTFPGGVPSTSSLQNPGEVIFPGVTGSIVAYLANLTITDATDTQDASTCASVGRASAKLPKTTQKWIVVDGVNSQNFNLSFNFRQITDSSGSRTLTPVVTAAHGLGATIQIFQDGVSYSYQVQDALGLQAQVALPVRSNLPFYVKIPGFGTDATSYLMRVPNASTGAYADPTLEATATTGSSTFYFSTVAPVGPTLKIVTAQGFAPESTTAPQRKLNGYTNLEIGTTPSNERWLDRLSVPADDPTGAIQWSQSNNAAGQLGNISAYQLFAEWPTLIFTRGTKDLAEAGPDPTITAGKSTDLGFVLDYAKYAGDSQLSETFAGFSMQAFRVPAGVTDPYQLSPAWQSASAELDNTVFDPHAGLNPLPVNGAVSIFLNKLVYSSPGAAPLAGGIQDLPLPYDPNDPNRIPLASPTARGYSGIRQVFTYSEYLWSTVWARPLVLNSARPSYGTSILTFPYFRYSNPAAWPKASAISPQPLSAFDLTVHGGGVFDGSAPVSVAPSNDPTNVPPVPTTGVGRFFWTAFTPSYQGDANTGAAIARTWLADDSTKQAPTTFTGSASGDATVALGFMTPQDTIVDKRGRNADGSLSGVQLGGYRVTWFNPTKDQNGNPVPPDFWVVELKDASGTKHFMLPGSYPTATQALTDLIMTDARVFLPSGNAASAGPATTSGTVTDKVAPGYCWFDVPVELRPTPGATLTVFAVKSILKNHAVTAARPLNRPDWIDAIKTATATMKMLTSSGSDLTYAYKIPFNFDWDIVVASGPQTPVAP